MEPQKFRGVKTVLLVEVLEGNGKDVPFEVVDYVLAKHVDGSYSTYGKVIPLTMEEKKWLGKDENN